jgi:hypothetical protein
LNLEPTDSPSTNKNEWFQRFPSCFDRQEQAFLGMVVTKLVTKQAFKIQMGHSQELLEHIQAQITGQYPEQEYRYEFEKPLYFSDRRNQPDIQVFDGNDRLVSGR